MKNNTAKILKKHLFDSMDFILDNKDKYLVNPATAFSRTQKISFRDTMLFPIIISNESTPIELLDYFNENDLPSDSAMIYRRNQLKVSAFRELLYHFTNKLSDQNKYQGMPLIACDGTRVNTPYNPKDSDSFVNCIDGRKGFNQYHLNTLYDILNDKFIDAVIQGYFSMNEQQAFCEMLDCYPQDNPAIFTLDRGYAAFNVIAHVINNNQNFVIRLNKAMAKNLFHDNSESNTSNEFDVEDVVNIGRIRTKAARSMRNYHYLAKEKTYDYIPAGSKNIDSFNLRLVKFMLPSGEAEYLLTNLSKSDFSETDIKEIYHLRWNIEVSFRFAKYVSGLVHIHSLKQDFILQEIYAKLICFNFCAAVMLETDTDISSKKIYIYNIEKTYLFKTCIRFLKGKIKNIANLYLKRKVPVRAGRNFDRNIRRQHADTLQYR